MLIAAEGIITLVQRYGDEAERLGNPENDPRRNQELLELAAICRHVPANLVRSFYEAMQSVYLYHICTFMEQNAAGYNPGLAVWTNTFSLITEMIWKPSA